MKLINDYLWEIFRLDSHDQFSVIKTILDEILPNDTYQTYRELFSQDDNAAFVKKIAADFNDDHKIDQLLEQMIAVYYRYKVYDRAIDLKEFYIERKEAAGLDALDLLLDYNHLAELAMLRDRKEPAFEILKATVDKIKRKSIRPDTLVHIVHTYQMLARVSTIISNNSKITEVEQYSKQILKYLQVAQDKKISNIDIAQEKYRIYNALTISHTRELDFDKTIEVAQTAFKLEKDLDMHHQENIDISFNLNTLIAKAYLGNNLYKDALRYATKAEALTEQYDIEPFELFTLFSYIHTDMEDIDTALAYAKRAEKLIQSTRDELYVYESFLRIHKFQRDKEKIDLYSDKILQLQQKNAGDEEISDASTKCSLAFSALEVNDLESALAFNTEALQSAEDDLTLHRVYKNFIHIYAKLGDGQQIDHYMKKLFEIDINEVEKIADEFVRKDDSEQAYAIAKKLLQFAHGDKDFIKIFKIFVNKYIEDGKHNETDLFVTKLMDLAKNYENIEEIGVHELCALSVKFKEDKAYNKALDCANKALRVANIDDDYLKVYHTLKDIYLELGDNEKAAQQVGKVNSIMARTTQDRDWKLRQITVQYDKLNLFLEKKDYPRALASVQLAGQILNSVKDPDPMEYVKCYNNFATVYIKIEDYDNAISYANRSINNRTYDTDSDHIDFAKSYDLKFTAFGKQNKVQEAYDNLVQAIQIYEKNLPQAQGELERAKKNLTLFAAVKS
jgi:hypothetical protein